MVQDLLRIVNGILSSVQPGPLSDDLVQQLRFVFPDSLALAAFDLVDRESVIQYTSGGRFYFEVLGSTGNYTVFPALLASETLPVYCTCPAFTYSVLLSESQTMCKHLLATRLAQQMSRCIERPVSDDELAAIIVRQYT